MALLYITAAGLIFCSVPSFFVKPKILEAKTKNYMQHVNYVIQFF